MPAKHVRITSNGSNPLNGTLSRSVEINGVRLQGVTSVSYDMNAVEPPTVTIELRTQEAEVEAGDAVVIVGEQTRETLLRLGWTPPSGD